MSVELMLKTVMEDLSSIKESLQVIVRLEEKTTNINNTLTRVVNKQDDLDRRIIKAEIALAGRAGTATGNNKFIMWVAAFISAFLIAMYINSSKPAIGAVMPNQNKVAIQLEIEKHRPKKD